MVGETGAGGGTGRMMTGWGTGGGARGHVESVPGSFSTLQQVVRSAAGEQRHEGEGRGRGAD